MSQDYGISKKKCYDLMYMKTKELSWKENQRIQNNGIKDSQENVTADQRQVLKIWEYYISMIDLTDQNTCKSNLKRRYMKIRKTLKFWTVKWKNYQGDDGHESYRG
jgi:hypothetical protein